MSHLKITARLTFLILVMPLLAGCLTLQKLSPDDSANIRTIGVASGIGETFSFDSYGWVTNRSYPGDIRNWGLDDRIFRLSEKYLAPRYAVKRIPVEQSKLTIPGIALFDSPQSAANRFFSAITPDPEVDAYLAIMPHEYNGDLDGVGKNVQGLGILQRFSQNYAIAFGAYQIFLFDARTRKSLAWWYGFLPDGKGGPMRILLVVSSQLWANNLAEASPQQIEALQKMYEGILDSSIPYTLLRANLIRETPD